MSELWRSVGTMSASAAWPRRFIRNLAWFPARACSPVATVKILLEGYSVSMTYLLSLGWMTVDVVPESITAIPSIHGLFCLLIVIVVTLCWIFRIILSFVFVSFVVFKAVSLCSLCRCFASFRSQDLFNLLMVCSDSWSFIVLFSAIRFICSTSSTCVVGGVNVSVRIVCVTSEINSLLTFILSRCSSLFDPCPRHLV